MRNRCLSTLALLAGASLAFAVDADPHKEYPVTPEVGPWLICAASYIGPEARQKAHDLVLDIRGRYRLPAYVFNRGEKERQAEHERLRQLKEKAPEGRFRTIRIEDQYAVLVGGYKDIDAARKALNDIKKLKPSDTRLMNLLIGGTAPGPDAARDKKDPVTAASYVSPFMDAFVVPNPTAPPERKVERKDDLKRYNAGEEYSLLKCRQPWTLAVATFQGTSVIQSDAADRSFLDKLLGKGGDSLSASALNAHNCAEAIRKLGFEAYVLHLRQGSLVTVGGFSSKDDPRMKQTQQELAKYQIATGQGLTHQMLPQPMPMEVPRP